VNILYHAHSGLRYLVLLVALVALIALAYSLATGRRARVAQLLATTFAGLLDLQIVLGVGLVVGGIFPDAVTGHLILMVLAAVVTHAAYLIGQHSSSERRELGFRLSGIALAVVLIVGGILAIGRSVLGSAPVTTGYSYDGALRAHTRSNGFTLTVSGRHPNPQSADVRLSEAVV
jgi:heme A synthase